MCKIFLFFLELKVTLMNTKVRMFTGIFKISKNCTYNTCSHYDVCDRRRNQSFAQIQKLYEDDISDPLFNHVTSVQTAAILNHILNFNPF